MIGGYIGHQHIGKTEEKHHQHDGVPLADTHQFPKDTVEDNGRTEGKEQDDHRSDIQGAVDTEQGYQQLVQSVGKSHQIRQQWMTQHNLFHPPFRQDRIGGGVKA